MDLVNQNFRLTPQHKQALDAVAARHGQSLTEYLLTQATFTRIEALTTPFVAGVVRLAYAAIIERIADLTGSDGLTDTEAAELASMVEWKDFLFKPLVLFNPPRDQYFTTRALALLHHMPESIRARLCDVENLLESIAAAVTSIPEQIQLRQ